MLNLKQYGSRWGGWVAAILLVGVAPVVAQPSNFGVITLSQSNRNGGGTGSTGGSTSLPAIVSNSDRNGNKCLGFGDPKPDHLLVLQQNFANLRLKVDSGGSDTTLVVVGGPGNVVRCADDSAGNNKDATLEDTDWKEGTYQVWVGSENPGTRRDYRLSVRGN